MASILVIDDDPSLLQLIRRILESANHQVTVARVAEDGLRHAHEYPPDGVILDLMMPDSSGFDLCRQLRNDPRTANVPILILSARAQPLDRQAALAAGATDYLSKPIGNKELLAKVAQLTNDHHRAKPGSPHGRVTVVLGLRGGVGATTIAVNLAVDWARHAPTILVDLSPRSGHASLQLRLPVRAHWGSLLDSSSIAPQAIEALLQTHESGLRLLAAPVTPLLGRDLPGLLVGAMLSHLQTLAQHVVVDVPGWLGPATLACLEMADQIELVLSPDVSSVQTTLATLRALAGQPELAERLKGRLHLVLNHPWAGPGLQEPVVVRSLGQPLTTQVPHDPQQMAALTRGVPLAISQPDSALVAALRSIRAEFVSTG